MAEQSIKEIIQKRHSVRNYDGTPLPQETIDKIKDYIKNLTNPFDKKIRIELIQQNSGNESIKLGTYGVIKGANHFLAAACEKDDLSLTALGYSLEKLILYCTSLGLGTVWLGGTFNKGNFAKAINLKENEVLPIVSPVGYEGGKKSLFAKLAEKNTNKRNDFSKSFFNGDFNTPLTESDAGEYYEPLEMLRLAPSAVNKQPWRVLKQNNNIHFYLAETNKYTSMDIGIALCHFHLTAMENNIAGELKIDDPKIGNNDLTYVMSWEK